MICIGFATSMMEITLSNREWATELADLFESGEMKWGQHDMATVDDNGDICHCLLGGVAVISGAVFEECTCDDDFPRHATAVQHEDDELYTERYVDLGAYLIDHDGATPTMVKTLPIIRFNDAVGRDKDAVVAKLREFAGAGEE